MSKNIGEIKYNDYLAQKCRVREATEKNINSLFSRNVINQAQRDELLQMYLRGEISFGEDGLTEDEAKHFTQNDFQDISNNVKEKTEGGTKTTYIIQPGDTPEKIAQKMGLEGDDAKNFARKIKAQAIKNGMYKRYGFQTGDMIILPGDFNKKIANMQLNGNYATDTKSINENYREAVQTKTEEHTNSSSQQIKKNSLVDKKILKKDEIIAQKVKADANTIVNGLKNGASPSNKLLDNINASNVVFVLALYNQKTGRSLANDLINNGGKNLKTVKDKVCWQLAKRAQELKLSGIYYGDYMNIKDAKKLTDWIDKAQTKIFAAEQTKNPAYKTLLSNTKNIKNQRNTKDIEFDAQILANNLFLEIDGFGSDNNKTKALLAKLTPENVAFVVEGYKNAKGISSHDVLITDVKIPKSNYTHTTLARAISREFGLGLDDIKSKICKKLVQQAKSLGLTGIYYGDYAKLNDINSLDSWINIVSKKIRSAMKLNQTQAATISNFTDDEKQKAENPYYKKAGIKSIKMSRDKAGNVLETRFHYEDGKSVTEKFVAATKVDGKRIFDNKIKIAVNNDGKYIVEDTSGNILKMLNGRTSFSINGKTYHIERLRVLTQEAKTNKTENSTIIKEPIPIKIKLPTGANEGAKKFAKALEENKATLMKELNLDNDTYNKLAKLALAIAEQETNFGTNGRYRQIKYNLGQTINESASKDLESFINNTLKDSSTIGLGNAAIKTAVLTTASAAHDFSAGPTQIKFNDQCKDSWIKNKMNKLGINKSADLYDMATSAKATMVILARNNSIIHDNKCYQNGMNAARGAVVANAGWEIKNGTYQKTGNTKPFVNTVTDEDALCYWWNGRSVEILDGTMEPESWDYTRNVRKSLSDYKIEEDKQVKSKAVERINTAKELTQPKYTSMENNGAIGSIVFMPKMYTNNPSNTLQEIDVLKAGLEKNNRINAQSKMQLLKAVENGEISFEFGLKQKEVSALTQNDVNMMLANLSKIKGQISATDGINFEDGIDVTEAKTLRTKYANMIRNFEFEFKKNYLKSHSKQVPLNMISKYSQAHNMLETPINNKIEWRNREYRNGFEGKVADKGVNSQYTSEASQLLAKTSQQIAKDRNSGGHCLQAVRDAMVETAIIKNSDKRKDQTIGEFSDFNQGTSRGAVRFFLDHPEAFEEVRMVKDGNNARQINSTDLPSLPAGYFVLWIPDDDFVKNREVAEPGHISITNGYGQAYADETDNLDWGNYRGLGVDKKDASGKGEHGTFRVFRLTNKWKVENGKLKFNS